MPVTVICYETRVGRGTGFPPVGSKRHKAWGEQVMAFPNKSLGRDPLFEHLGDPLLQTSPSQGAMILSH